MAFPVLNMLSFWTTFVGFVVIIAAFFVSGGAPLHGWTGYAPLSALPSAGPGEGLERVEHWRDEFLASFQELRIEALELEPIGDRVLVRVRQRGRFRTTGIDVDVTYFQLWTFSGGRATRFQVFELGAEVEARAMRSW